MQHFTVASFNSVQRLPIRFEQELPSMCARKLLMKAIRLFFDGT
jgi:hypothetical protein